MNKTNTKHLIYIIIVIIISPVLIFACSCGKKEPEAQPAPSDIIKKINEKFPGNTETTQLTQSEMNELYSENSKKAKNSGGKKAKDIDLSKIEKYSIAASKINATEIAVFKLYDKTNAEYVKQMAAARILSLQKSGISQPPEISRVFNDAEVRSYGNYVYYAAHPQKDKIFEIIEDMLKGA